MAEEIFGTALWMNAAVPDSMDELHSGSGNAMVKENELSQTMCILNKHCIFNIFN